LYTGVLVYPLSRGLNMKYCFVAVVSLGLSGLAFSQGFGTIVGTVTDPSGALVAAAKV